MTDPSLGGEDDDVATADSLLREVARIAPIESSEPDRVGQTLGRFRLDGKLGQGGMGVVYAAEDLELGRSVALKVLPRAAVADDERRRRFLREARTAAALAHSNIAAIFEVGEADGTVFLAMELVRGVSLRAKIAAAPNGMAVADALSIASQIANGLGAAHAAGVVHRDLKPENVMLDEESRAKVVDFGLAKPAASDSAAGASDLSTEDGRILGTPSYMAPEQAKGSRVGPAADVFSFGVVFYEMLTGRRPFAGDSLVDVLVAIARDEPRAPSKRAPAVSRELDRIVLRCLAKDPRQRYQDGAAIAGALAAVARRAGRRPSRWPLLVAGGASVAVAMTAWAITQRGPATSAPAPAALAPSAEPPAAAATIVPAPPAVSAAVERSAGRGDASIVTPPSPTGRAAIAMPRRQPSARPSALGAPKPSVDPLARQK